MAVFQRIDQAGYKLPIDERILDDTDTLLVFGLDHLVSEQEAAPEEIAAIREWLKREDTCLLIGPHHDVGFTADLKQRQMEYKPPRRRAGAAPAAVRPVHPIVDEGARRAGAESVRSSTGRREGHRIRSRRSRSTRTSTRSDCSRASRRSTSTCTCRTMR